MIERHIVEGENVVEGENFDCEVRPLPQKLAVEDRWSIAGCATQLAGAQVEKIPDKELIKQAIKIRCFFHESKLFSGYAFITFTLCAKMSEIGSKK